MGGCAAQKIERSADAFQAGHGLMFSRTERGYKPARRPTKSSVVTISQKSLVLGGRFRPKPPPMPGIPINSSLI